MKRKFGIIIATLVASATSGADVVELNENKKDNLWKVDPRKIGKNPNNHRVIDINSEDMQELIASVRANGIITALMLKPNPDFGVVDGAPEYVSYAGNRRISAVHYLINVEGLDIKHIPAQIKKRVSLEEEYLTQIVENSGVPFTFLERAELFANLVKVCNFTPKDIKEQTGVEEAAVSNYLLVAGFTKKQKKMIADNYIAAGLAMRIARESDSTEEFEAKMNELFDEAEKLLASGVKKTKRAIITDKNAGDALAKKKPLAILEEVCFKLEQGKVEGDNVTLINEIVKLLRKQNKNTTKNIFDLFS